MSAVAGLAPLMRVPLRLPVYMQIGNRVIRKRIHVRIEHVAPSRCREEFLARTQKNDAIKHAAKERGGKPSLPLILFPALLGRAATSHAVLGVHLVRTALVAPG